MTEKVLKWSFNNPFFRGGGGSWLKKMKKGTKIKCPLINVLLEVTEKIITFIQKREENKKKKKKMAPNLEVISIFQKYQHFITCCGEMVAPM